MNTSLKKILLAIDGSQDAALVLRAAADLSERAGAELRLVHVLASVPPPAYHSSAFDDFSRLARQEAEELLRRRAWDARVAGGEVVGEHLREGKPAQEIVALAEGLGADLVVVGTRGAGPVGRLIMGSVSEGVVRRAPCPVLVVRGGEGAWPPRRIVVGYDGSGPAERAGEIAAEIADLSGVEIVLVRAHENPPEPVGGWSARGRRELDEAFLRARQALDERAEQLRALARDRPATRLIEAGAALALSSAAREGDEGRTLLAVGSRGLSAPGRALLGSVSTKALRAADGPVLVVPPEAAPPRRPRNNRRRRIVDERLRRGPRSPRGNGRATRRKGD